MRLVADSGLIDYTTSTAGFALHLRCKPLNHQWHTATEMSLEAFAASRECGSSHGVRTRKSWADRKSCEDRKSQSRARFARLSFRISRSCTGRRLV